MAIGACVAPTDPVHLFFISPHSFILIHSTSISTSSPLIFFLLDRFTIPHHRDTISSSSSPLNVSQVLANSVVKGRFADEHVPPHLQNLLSAESGANDGAGYPFLFLSLYLLNYPVGEAIGKWFYLNIAYNIILSCIIGFVAGYVAKRLLKFAEGREWTDKESFFAYTLALAVSHLNSS